MNVFSFIKKHVTILEVISSYTTLQKAGLYWKGRCPFHHEKTASFTVSPHKEIFYCFGCHAGGDAISFIAKAEQCNSFEAAQHLAQRFNIEIPEQYLTIDKQSSEQLVQEKKRYWQLCELVAQWCHQQINPSKAINTYLTNRKISNETIELFTIGYFPSGSSNIQSLIQYVKKAHFLVQDLLDAHILCQGKTSLFSPFEDRLIFPIKDSLGRCSGFGGRIFKADDQRPKYYNSKENDYFNKGSLLFGFDLARQSIQQTMNVFLVEGYFDCIAMVQAGYSNTVATLGTACTIDHLKLLARYARKVYVVYDSDKAGQQAMLRLTELCWQVDLDLQVISLPAGEDPASFLSKNSTISACMDQAEDIFSYFIRQSGNSFTDKSLHDKVQITRKLLMAISRINDPLKRDLLIQKSSNTLALSADILKEEIKRLLEKPEKKPDSVGLIPENHPTALIHDPLKEITELEKKLFSVIINNMHLLKDVEEGYLLEYLSIPLKNVLKKLKLVKGEEKQIDFIQFFEALDIQEKQIISKLMLEFAEYQNEQNFEQLLMQFQKKHWKSFVKDIKLKLDKAQKEGNEQKIKKLISDFQDLKQRLLPKGLV